MCNLYTVRQSPADLARAFDATAPTLFNTGAEVLPGQQGMVIREVDGQRVLLSMAWGFPLPMKSKKTGLPIKPKPVNNIANLQSGMWRSIAGKPANRCLIPVSAFAEAEGEAGAKTRTWFSVKDQPLFAWPGLWRESAEWGSVFSGLMTDANDAVRPVHDRMPVILHFDEHDQWLHGTIEDVVAFQARTFPADLIVMEKTAEPWIRRRSPSPAA